MTEAFGRATPLIRLSRFSPSVPLFAKAEYLHPSGSAYDRVAGPLLFASSGPAIVAGAGSVCLAFCRAAALQDRDLYVVCPDSTLPEHQSLIARHSVRLVRSPGKDGLLGAHLQAELLASEVSGTIVFSLRVFEAAQRLFADSLGEEIVHAFEVLDERPEAVVAPIAAGAILGGIGSALERRGFLGSGNAGPPATALIGTVRPRGDSVQDGTVERSSVVEPGVTVAEVSDAAAFATRMSLARTEGLLVGMGSAAAVRAAAERGVPGIAIIVDAGDRYFSVDRRLSGS